MTTAEIPRYQFEETGVGCAEHADPACLCDVQINSVTPIAYGPGSVLYGRLAADLCKGEITFEGWAGWLCAITDEAARVKVNALCEILAEARLASSTNQFGGDNRPYLQRAYYTLLAAGYGTEKCAELLGTTPETLFELIARQATQKIGLEGLYLLEFMLQDASLSATAIAKELGCGRDVVTSHADRMNVQLPLGPKAAAMQPHVVASMNKWTAEGLSSRQVVGKVLEETGVKVSSFTVLRHAKESK